MSMENCESFEQSQSDIESEDSDIPQLSPEKIAYNNHAINRCEKFIEIIDLNFKEIVESGLYDNRQLESIAIQDKICVQKLQKLIGKLSRFEITPDEMLDLYPEFFIETTPPCDKLR